MISLETALLKSSSESIGLSDPNVWGVAGSAATSTVGNSECEILVALVARGGGDGTVVAEVEADKSLEGRSESAEPVVVLSSFLFLDEGGVVGPEGAGASPNGRSNPNSLSPRKKAGIWRRRAGKG